VKNNIDSEKRHMKKLERNFRTVLLWRASILTSCVNRSTIYAFSGIHRPETTTRSQVRYYHDTCRFMSNDFENLIQAANAEANGVVMGGDFAGLAATFNPGDGSFIPVPVHLVPNALLEWGQEPKCLELLVSEESNDGETMTRHTITVLPGTGCSIDNLETTKVDDTIDLSSKYGRGTNVVGLQYEVGTKKNALRLESIFGMPDGYRMRVLLDVIPSSSTFAVQSPMVLALERRTNTFSSSGTIADGGGLDGRTVSMLLGEYLRRSRTFVDDPPLDGYHENNDLKHVSLPGNVSIAYGWITDGEWVVQTSHVHEGIRRVLSRRFLVVPTTETELDFAVDSWTEDYVPGNL